MKEQWKIWRERWKNRSIRSKIGIGSCFGFLSFLFLGLSFYYAVLLGFFGVIPTQKDLSAIQNPVASEIYADNQQLLGKFYIENRTYTEWDQISPHIIHALVATEDARFYEHDGIDLKSYGRVFFKTILGRDKSAGGGSTLSQQLAKNLFPRKNYGRIGMPIHKVREAIIASRLEEVYSKNEILLLYLNTVSFGERAFGIATATERFFSTTPRKVSIEEAATLIGLLKATSAYSPRLHPERSKERRNVVLKQMMKEGYLTEGNLKSHQSKPFVLKYNKTNQISAAAPYYRVALQKEVRQWLNEHPKEDGSVYNVLTDGLKIYTSINPTMQQYAEEAVQEHMKDVFKTFKEQLKGQKPWGKNKEIVQDAMYASKRYKRLNAAGKTKEQILKDFNVIRPMKVFSWNGGEANVKMSPMDSLMHYLYFMNASFMAANPKNGQIKAWVGGIDYSYFKVDHVNSKSQVGSTFKPLVYATALEEGISPCKFYPNERRTYQDYKDWSPRNADNHYEGAYTLKGGLTNSVNTVSVQVLFEAGIDNIINLAERVGIKNKIPAVPSIALGTAELSLKEMVGAYTTFSNNGVAMTPHSVLRIEDAKGNVIHDFTNENQKKKQVAIDPETNTQMVEMLQAVVDEGTGRRLRFQFGLTNEIAGKTGTTQNQTDGWFLGCTPDLVAGAWVGAEDKRIRFATTTQGQGARTALPIWGKFFKKLYAHPKYAKLAQETFDHSVYKNMDCPLYSDVMPRENSSKDQRTFLSEIGRAIFGINNNIEKRKTESLEDKVRKLKAEKNRKILEAKKKLLNKEKEERLEKAKTKRELDRKKREDKRRKKAEAREEKARKAKEKKAADKKRRAEERKRKAEAKNK